MIDDLPIKIESRVSAEITGAQNEHELQRMLRVKAQEARIDSYRRSYPNSTNRSILRSASEIKVFMTTEKSGEITKFRFFVRKD